MICTPQKLAAWLTMVVAFATTAQTLPGSPPPADSGGELFRVQIAAQRQTTLSAEISAKLVHLPLKEGDAFKSGQMLAGFDCAIYRAQLGKVQASADASRQTLKVNRRLAELDSISTLEVDLSAAKLKEVEADFAAVNVTLSKCSISAPFSGRVAKVYAEPHQFIPQGKPLLDIVDTQRLEVRLIVPSKWLGWLRKGTRFTVHVDDLNLDVTAVVSRLGARIDPVNQTVSLVGEITTAVNNLLPGMSGSAKFQLPGKP
jgi:membrane fusion protein (multidrug efflux system)